MGKLCQYCNKREAKIHFTEIKDGKKTEMHICEQCAHEKNMVLAFPSLPVLSQIMKGGPAAARRVMRYKRARTVDELTRQVAAAMPDATDEQREIEHARRLEPLRMKRLLVEQWNLDEIEADLQWCGLSGSPTRVHRVQSIVRTKEGHTEVEPTEEGIRKMIHELIVEHTLG